MMIESNYSLNVARDTGCEMFQGGRAYGHYCRIELGNAHPDVATIIARDIAERFPSPEFKVTLSRVECSGRDVAF